MIEIRQSESFYDHFGGKRFEKGTEQPKLGVLNDLISLWLEMIGRSMK